MYFEFFINLPEAILLSDRPGHFFFYQVFNPVHQRPHHGPTDRVFFKSRFRPRCQWPHHGLSDRVFLKRYYRLGRQWPYHGLTDRARGMVTDILCQKSDKKTPICETMVWPLTLKKPGLGDRGMVTASPGQKPECWRPSSNKTSPYWWMMDAGVRIGAFWIAVNTMAQTGRRRIQSFFLDVRPLPFHAIVFAAIRKATIRLRLGF